MKRWTYCDACGSRLVQRVFVLWKSRDEASVGVHRNGVDANGVAKAKELENPYCVFAGVHESEGRQRRAVR